MNKNTLNDNTLALLEKGRECMNSQDYQGAIKNFRNLVKVDPDNIKAYFYLAQAYLKLQNNWINRWRSKSSFKKAIRLCKKAIKHTPNKRDSYYILGDIYREMKYHRKAIKAYKNSLKFKPSKYLENILINEYKERGVNKTNAYYEIGILYKECCFYEEAIKVFENVILENSNNEILSLAIKNIWEIYQNQKRFQEAIDFFGQLSTKIPLALKYLGKAYSEWGDYEEAIKVYKQIIDKNPRDIEAYESLFKIYKQMKDADALYRLGEIYFNLKMYNDSIDVFKELIYLDPQSVDGYIYLGSSYHNKSYTSYKKEGNNCFKTAIKISKDLLKNDPNNPQLHYQLGFSYARLGKKDFATQQYSILKKMESSLADDLFKNIDL